MYKNMDKNYKLFIFYIENIFSVYSLQRIIFDILMIKITIINNKKLDFNIHF
jgi:hypothetical protein